jgi:hypothetical protein
VNIVASDHARENMNLMHVSMRKVEQIITDPEVVYPQEQERWVAQAGTLSVVYVTEDDDRVVIVTVLKRKRSQWTRRRTP